MITCYPDDFKVLLFKIYANMIQMLKKSRNLFAISVLEYCKTL